jgi:hypothetical protein
MTVRYRPLFTLGVVHGFYDRPCPDFGFVFPTESAQRLRGGKLLARERDGVLHVLFESRESGEPTTPLGGKVIQFGLQSKNPQLGNITAFTYAFPLEVPAFTNFTAAGTLAPRATVTVVGRILAHRVRTAERPVTITTRDAEGGVVDERTIADASRALTFALDNRPKGLVEVAEVAAGGVTEIMYYFEPELAPIDTAAIVEIEIDESFYGAPAAFQIAFAPRSEPLSYYVVARNHTVPEFNQLAVTDRGETGRPTIAFTRIAPSGFTATDPSPAILASSSERLVLFRSTVAVPRRERGRKGIQLARGDDVLIPHLPQPGADRANAAMIVHVSKS